MGQEGKKGKMCSGEGKKLGRRERVVGKRKGELVPIKETEGRNRLDVENEKSTGRQKRKGKKTISAVKRKRNMGVGREEAKGRELRR